MSHSKKDTNEEVDGKTGRRIQSIVGSETVHSPLRRSSRVKSLVKQNEPSPEISLGDVGNINSSHTTRNTRRRIDSPDNSTMTEKARTLRSRRSSVTSDMIGTSDTDTTIVTSVKRNRNISDNEELNKTDFQTSKRFTRAGSEAKSPPIVTRVTRRTRASSMEPEAIIESNLIETNNSGAVLTPVNTRKRRSMLSLKTSMLEETMIPVVTLDRMLPSVKEINETNLENPTVEQVNKSESESKDPLNASSENASKEQTETDLSVKEVHNNSMESSPAHQDTEVDIPNVDKSTVSSTDDTKEDVPSDTITSSVALVKGILKPSCQISTEDTIREAGQTVENSVTNSIKEEDEHLSDKENQPANIIDGAQNKEDTVSNVLLRSPKQIAMSSSSTNKSIKDNDNEADSSDDIQKLVVTSNESLSETPLNDSADQNASGIEACETNKSIKDNDNEADSSNDIQRLVVTSEESLSETPLNDNTDQNASGIEVCDGSSIDDNIEIVKCPDNLSDSENGKDHSTENKTEELTQEVSSDGETFRKEKNVDTILSTEAEVQQSPKECVTKKCNESSDVHMESEDIESINEKEDETSNIIKSRQSSTATDFPVEVTVVPEVPEEDVTQNMSILDNSSELEKKSIDNSESGKETINESGIQETCKEIVKESGIQETCKETINESGIQETCNKTIIESEIQETCKKDEEKIKEDDNSDSNVDINLFQDIPADKWKELEDESENECDLVLVDKEAWQTTEGINKEEDVVVKAQEDTLKEPETEATDVSDQCKMNESKSPKTKLSRQSMQREKTNEIENVTSSQNAENVSMEKSSVEETLNESTLQNNTSMEEKVEDKNLVTKSEDDSNKLGIDLSSDNRKLSDNVLKKRISLSKSVEIMNSEAEESSESEILDKMRSMTKSPGSLLCDSSSSNKSDKSIDSDIEREYNLCGEEPSKFSDDDVPGDECRASETESSDPNDNGSDLADFVVNDDDISEEEEERKSESDNELSNNENIEVQESDVDEQHGKVQIPKEVEEKVMKKEQQNKTVEGNIEAVINKSTDTTSRKKGKLKKSINLNLSEMYERAKKDEKKSKVETGNKRRKKRSMKDNNDKKIKTKTMKYEEEYKNQAGGSNTAEVSRKGVKRISQDVLGNLSDVPLRVLKKRKQSTSEKQELPSRSMNNLSNKKKKVNIGQDFISLSAYGSTTNFYVENLRKLMKSRKTLEVQSFRQRMLQKNARQRVSHYLMYLEKQKSSDKRKFRNKPC